METRRCISCQRQIDSQVCPSCGYPVQSQNEPHQLPVGTMLRGRYQVGKVLGQGGFGITYLGFDTLMETTVAIKEFYPSGVVNRKSEHSTQVECLTEKLTQHYYMSRERFLREARALVKFRGIPEVVDLLDFVEENNTAYIVMEYVRGVDLARYIQGRGGSLSVDETFRILKPVMEALAAVHKGDVVHRDISPDNIILDPMGGAKLLDFGAVRTVEDPSLERGLEKSTEAILKHGFAPLEQYNTRGSLGPWTDEYAMCATVFYCLTGRIPEEASIRVTEGIDPDWDSIPGLPEHQKRALRKGMSVRAKDRFPGMDQLLEALFSPAPRQAQPVSQPVFVKTEASSRQTHVRPRKEKKGKKWPVFAAIAAVLVVAILAVVLAPGLAGGKSPEPSAGGKVPETAPATAPNETVPVETIPESQVKTGLAVDARVSDSTSAAGGNDGTVVYDITFAAVTVDNSGVITSCKIDSVSASVKINSQGRITSDVDAPVLTKNELGADYGMVNWGGAIAEWDAQVAALCDYAVGKTVEQLRNGAVNESGYAVDADLASSATIYLGGYVRMIETAVNNARHLGARQGDELTLATGNSLKSSYSASAGDNGCVQLFSDIAVLTSRDGVITSCIVDTVQANVIFDAAGTIVTDLSAPIQTNSEMGDDYGMVAWGGAIAEWNEQAAAFAAYVTGKTAGEVAGIAVNERTAPAEADLASSVTIAIGGFQELIVKALAQ